MRTPKNRPPTHPGEILLKDFLAPMGISQTELAQAIHVPYQRINELVNGKRGVTPSTALRLSKFLGNSSEFWLNLQHNWELYYVLKEEEDDLNTISRFRRENQDEKISI
ncbi:HigA family addiction module antitoxin [Nodularia sphaerocarpa]|uniref:HigA family addiction module antitoxin n=1 Tax=Nodularia sphaerocarpa TaxID=137816 RepID=UPI001EFB854B|nr:HigA family addiction module antitoxin [Nodularia sphaerocarpa]MDB9374921.1 HigA family addiction module antitoxin [Nodularia sphaerocarpa CS-585]MDB9378555.1 HigA family addiction module antitoxin [Nodularia sphaerocarpa CS-585A2]ULP72727.1 putative HTH-type transcriptional regulator YbaQ [Nodularia sphaerocarpa UHCC 0038]